MQPVDSVTVIVEVKYDRFVKHGVNYEQFWLPWIPTKFRVSSTPRVHLYSTGNVPRQYAMIVKGFGRKGLGSLQ